MATSQDEPPTFRRDSPSPELLPKPALAAGAGKSSSRPQDELSRRVSTASSASHGSATTDASRPRESLGSFVSASDASSMSRHSSASFQALSRRSDASFLGGGGGGTSSRHSTMSLDRPKRRGYMRPQGTDFAASARQRESVLSLGSITHLQYYFARTGLLDGKGARLARKQNAKAQTLDFSQLDPSSFLLAPGAGATAKPGSGSAASDVDSSYASMGSSPDLGAHSSFVVESPIRDPDEDDGYYLDEYEEPGPGMLPPTASTYNHRVKPVPKPPTTKELRAELDGALDAATKTLAEARTGKDAAADEAGGEAKPKSTEDDRDKPEPSEAGSASPAAPARSPGSGWHEVQGVHILDVMTLAIRAAKVYYTGHDHPDRLDAIKPEKSVRAELLAVMDVLKRMATRNFAGGMRDDESRVMEGWVASLRHMLAREDAMVAEERAERAGWTWLRDEDWVGRRPEEREYAFIQSMLTRGPAPSLASPPIASSAASVAKGATAPTTGGPPPPLSPGPTASTTPTALTFTTVPAPEKGVDHALAEDDDEPHPPLPPWQPTDRSASPPAADPLPTPFLRAMQNGLALVRLHNAAVRKSQRVFGAIASYHVDTQKPYRCADNLRYWVKAAELRWELQLRGVDPLAIVYDNGGPAVWLAFEDAILAWCRKVREEIAAELAAAGLV